MIVDPDGREYFVFDDHAHLGSRPFRPVTGPSDYTAEQLIADMDASGVDMAVAFPRGNPHTDYYTHNEGILAAAQRYPNRIVPYARIQPYFLDKAVDHIAEFAERGVRGIKFHPFMDFGGTPVNSEELIFPLMEVISRHGLAVIFHSGEAWNCTPTLIGDVAAHFPDVPTIVGHCGLWEGHQEAMVIARLVPNLYLDTAEVAPSRVVSNCVRGVGADRVLFGADRPSIAYGHEIAKVAKYAELAPDDIELVLGLNIARLLNIDIDTSDRTRVEVGSL